MESCEEPKGRPARYASGKPTASPVLAPIDDEPLSFAGVFGVEYPGRSSTGRIARRTEQAVPRKVVEEHLLVRHTTVGVDVVVPGQASVRHKGEELAVRRNPGCDVREVGATLEASAGSGESAETSPVA